MKQMIDTIIENINKDQSNIVKGQTFSLVSNFEKDGDVKFWRVVLKVNQLGYGERIIQEWNYQWPSGMDRYRIEMNALTTTLKTLLMGTFNTILEIEKVLKEKETNEKK